MKDYTSGIRSLERLKIVIDSLLAEGKVYDEMKSLINHALLNLKENDIIHDENISIPKCCGTCKLVYSDVVLEPFTRVYAQCTVSGASVSGAYYYLERPYWCPKWPRERVIYE